MIVHGYYAVMNIHPTNLSTEANLVTNLLWNGSIYVPIVFQKKSHDEEEQEIKDCIVISDEDADIPESGKEDNEEHIEVIEEPSNEDNVEVIEQASNEDNIEVIEEPTTVR